MNIAPKHGWRYYDRQTALSSHMGCQQWLRVWFNWWQRSKHVALLNLATISLRRQLLLPTDLARTPRMMLQEVSTKIIRSRHSTNSSPSRAARPLQDGRERGIPLFEFNDALKVGLTVHWLVIENMVGSISCGWQDIARTPRAYHAPMIGMVNQMNIEVKLWMNQSE